MLSANSKSDPSGVLQFFAEVRLKIHCCRYWKLSQWSLENMVSPFWRLYHNVIPGSSIFFNSQSFPLVSEYVYLIPPNTPFSSHFKDNSKVYDKELLVGSRITEQDSLDSMRENQEFDHFFVHFNLGLHYDNVRKGIYQFSMNAIAREQIDYLKHSLRKEYKHINLVQTASIQALILSHIQKIPESVLDLAKFDSRVAKVLGLIERDFRQNLTNKDLAEKVAMAPNSFLRLFRQNTGQSIHSYIQKKRIEESVFLMHHTNKSIDQISQECGFCDRHHFSKAFKKQMNISPAYYRKQLTMK